MKRSIFALTTCALLAACGSEDAGVPQPDELPDEDQVIDDGDDDVVVTLGLTVKANGVAIGQVTAVEDYIVHLVDVDKGIYFGVNRQTGNVVGWAGGAFTAADCTGAGGIRHVETEAYNCHDSAATPSLRWVWGTGATADLGGWGEASSLQTTTGTPLAFSKAASYTPDTAECVADVDPNACGYWITSTTVIPTSFDTPITLARE